MHRTCCTSPLAHSIPVEKLTFTGCKIGRRSNIWHEKIDALQQCALWGKPHEITPLRIKFEAAVLADWLHSNGLTDGYTAFTGQVVAIATCSYDLDTIRAIDVSVKSNSRCYEKLQFRSGTYETEEYRARIYNLPSRHCVSKTVNVS